MNAAEWQTRNSQYLAASLVWLRQRLERLASESHSSAAEPVSDEHLAQAWQARSQAAQIDPPPALVALSGQLGLSPFEQNVL